MDVNDGSRTNAMAQLRGELTVLYAGTDPVADVVVPEVSETMVAPHGA